MTRRPGRNLTPGACAEDELSWSRRIHYSFPRRRDTRRAQPCSAGARDNGRPAVSLSPKDTRNRRSYPAAAAGGFTRLSCPGAGLAAELALVEAAVQAALGQQLRVRADLDDAALVHHDDAIGVQDGGQPVRDDHAGAAAHELPQRILDQVLALAVERAGGFVQDQDARVAQERARDGDALALPAGELGAALAEQRVVALGQLHDELLGVRGACYPAQRFVAGVGPAVQDVVAHAAREQHGVLGDDADLAAQRPQGHVAQIVAVDRDAPGVGIEEARDELNQRRLARRRSARPARSSRRHACADRARAACAARAGSRTRRARSGCRPTAWAGAARPAARAPPAGYRTPRRCGRWRRASCAAPCSSR